MGTLPPNKQDLVNFFSDRVNDWNDNAAAIGLTSERIAAFLTTRINPAAESLETTRQAREAARAATLENDLLVGQLADDGRALIALIQAFAKETARTGGDAEAVYALARLPAPKQRTPVGPPPQPESLTCDPQSDGNVSLTWKKGVTGRGSYQVERIVTMADGTVGESWSLVGAPIEREFVDTAVPHGATGVTYRVRGVNTSGPGAWSANVGCNLARQTGGLAPTFTLRSTIGRAA